jgi:hypothetical protein
MLVSRNRQFNAGSENAITLFRQNTRQKVKSKKVKNCDFVEFLPFKNAFNFNFFRRHPILHIYNKKISSQQGLFQVFG